MSLNEWDCVVRVNLTGQFLCARERRAREFRGVGWCRRSPAPLGRSSASPQYMTSCLGAGRAHYAASKAGVVMLMKTMAFDSDYVTGTTSHTIRLLGCRPRRVSGARAARLPRGAG